MNHKINVKQYIPVLTATLIIFVASLQMHNLLRVLGVYESVLDVYTEVAATFKRAHQPKIVTEASAEVLIGCEQTLCSGQKPTKLVIPVLSLERTIVETTLENGTWPVHEKVANYATETSLVNTLTGNVGLYGHDKNDALRSIKHLRTGDQIQVFTDDMVATYTVYSTETTAPENISVFYQTEQPILTVMTCTGQFSEQRFAIHAKLDTITNLN